MMYTKTRQYVGFAESIHPAGRVNVALVFAVLNGARIVCRDDYPGPSPTTEEMNASPQTDFGEKLRCRDCC